VPAATNLLISLCCRAPARLRPIRRTRENRLTAQKKRQLRDVDWKRRSDKSICVSLFGLRWDRLLNQLRSGRGLGVGGNLGVGVALGVDVTTGVAVGVVVGVGVTDGVTVGVCVLVGVTVGLTVGVGVTVAVGVGVGVGVVVGVAVGV
jgi:hypothetical protein